jgi:hypothetical protein
MENWRGVFGEGGDLVMRAPVTASDVAHRIRKTLSGECSKADLGRWAYLAWLDKDEERREFDVRQRAIIADVIGDLMFMDEGPEYYLDDEELDHMAKLLEDLGD